LNRRPLRPEQGALGNESAGSQRLRWPQTLSSFRSPRLTAPGGASPLPFRSQYRAGLAGRGESRGAVTAITVVAGELVTRRAPR
jgi:hypothetical protein